MGEFTEIYEVKRRKLPKDHKETVHLFILLETFCFLLMIRKNFQNFIFDVASKLLGIHLNAAGKILAYQLFDTSLTFCH